MADYQTIRTAGAGTRTAQIDEGLRAHMNKVYGLMSVGMLITGGVAWAVGTNETMLNAIFATPYASGRGQYNLGGYSQPDIDRLTLAVQSETDTAKRNALIREAFQRHQDDIGHIPLHQQALAWSMKKNIELVQLADNYMPFRWVVVK